VFTYWPTLVPKALVQPIVESKTADLWIA
jgi:hypothetical protein